ncbi:MAG: glycosyltransferase, partial [Bacteroidota bacterium]
MRIRIIIPVLNEANNLQELLPYLKKELANRGDIIVADGGSTDDSAAIAASHSVQFYASPRPGRAAQMNAAAAACPDCDAFYFVHADTRPPVG